MNFWTELILRSRLSVIFPIWAFICFGQLARGEHWVYGLAAAAFVLLTYREFKWVALASQVLREYQVEVTDDQK